LKIFADILHNVTLLEVVGNTQCMVESVAFDSRKVLPNTIFVAIKGLTTDGHKYIDQAIEKGATAIVCEQLPNVLKGHIAYVRVADCSKALGILAANYYDHPSQKITLVGVTGTNGKTTVATLLHQLFTNMGFRCGLLSTVKNLVEHTEIEATHTTPDPLQINHLLSLMVQRGCKYVFMEVSSHAVVQQRIEGLRFAVGVFTNLTHDHLDFHKTFANYLKAKKKFFDTLSVDAVCITNADDKNGAVMLQNTRSRKMSYSLKSQADYRGRIIENGFSGLTMAIDGHEVWFRLVGEFNAYNILAVYATARALGFESAAVLTALSTCQPAKGRFEYFTGKDKITGIVDYAHTPDALLNVLSTIGAVSKGGEKIITVVGAGGNRDAAKRPEMARIAVKGSSKVILTSDNPRFEDPIDILEQMKKGLTISELKDVLTIENRAEAIKTACCLAQPGDIILVAGKGHENYQEIKGVKYPFDDMKLLQEFLA